MSNFEKQGWCRYCKAWLKHTWIDCGVRYVIMCNNCQIKTPEKAFLRHQKRREDFVNKIKK